MDSNGNKPSNPVRRSSSLNECENESQVAVEINRVVLSKEPMDSSTAYGYAPTANNSQKIVTSNRKPLKRSNSKPKSRFGEQPCYMGSYVFEENDLWSLRDQTVCSASDATKEQHKKEVDEEMYKVKELTKRKQKKEDTKKLMKWVGVVCTIGCLVASLSVHPLKNCYLWGLKLWKWCLLATVTFFGMIITGAVQLVIVALIENYYTHNNEVFYLVHGLKKSVRAAVWLTLVLVTWFSLFDRSSYRDLRSKTTRKILDAIARTLITLLLGSILWLAKTLSLKILATKFRMNRFFDRFHNSILHQHVLQTLLNPALSRITESTAGSKRCGFILKSNKSDKKPIDIGKIRQLRGEKVTPWTMKVLANAFKTSNKSISQLLDECYCENVADGAIADEMECARDSACKIFNNIALPGNKFIEPEDLLKVMIKEEVELVLDQTEKIDMKTLTNWVVRPCIYYLSLFVLSHQSIITIMDWASD